MNFVMGIGESSGSNCSSSSTGSFNMTVLREEEGTSDLRRGPWTVDEDKLLVNHIKIHGEGRWNSLSSCAGLKRTGKSCRLRWLNYLRPDVRRGNITPEEQLVILQLHARWGNRWSKIAQHLPGRTDNEIKNYWRTRVQKQAKQLKCDVNSQKFKDVVQYLWMPRLMEKIRPNSTTVITSTAEFVGNDESAVKSKQSLESSVEESSLNTLMLSQLSSPSPPVSELVNWAEEINQGFLDFDDNGGWWGSTSCDINLPDENFWNSMDSINDFFWS